MKGNSKLFGLQKQNGRWDAKTCIISNKSKTNGIKYDFKNHIIPHSIPIKNIPNSTITQYDENWKIIRIRYYDDNGNAYKDVDYTDHNRPDSHKVPHTHIIEIGDIIIRKKGVKNDED